MEVFEKSQGLYRPLGHSCYEHWHMHTSKDKKVNIIDLMSVRKFRERTSRVLTGFCYLKTCSTSYCTFLTLIEYLQLNYTKLDAKMSQFTKMIKMIKKCFKLNSNSLKIGISDNYTLIVTGFLLRNFNIFTAAVLLFLKN